MKTIFDIDSVQLKDLPNVIKMIDDLVMSCVKELGYKTEYRYLSNEEVDKLVLDKAKMKPITQAKDTRVCLHEDLLLVNIRDALFVVECDKEEG